MASTGKVRARRGHLAAAVRAVVSGIVLADRAGRRRAGRAAVVDPLERRVFLSTSSLPTWLAAGSAATWDASTGKLTVTGPATIVADPGSDAPLVTVAGAGAALTIQPVADTWIHLGSLTLVGGGSAEFTRPSAGAFSESGSLVLELGTAGTAGTTPLLSVDASAGSTLGIEDNDLIVRGAENYAQDFLRSVAVQANGIVPPGGVTLDPNAYHEDGLIIPGWSATAADWAVEDRTLWLAPGDVLAKFTPLGQDDAAGWTSLDTPASAPSQTGPAYPSTPLVREQVGPAYPAAFFASSFEQPALASGPTPAYVSSVVVNGNDTNLLGPQRSMVDDLLYTFSQPVTLDPTTAFSIAVQPNQPGTAPTLAWSAVNPDSTGGSTTWTVTFTGPSVINRSIANGVYSLVLNTSAVTSEANPSLPAAAHNPDLFFRLYGDADGNGTVDGTNDYGQFQQSLTTYNPIFDCYGTGNITALDYSQFKHDLNVTYAGTISFNPAALRPTNLTATADGPASVTLSWTGPSNPTVSGYTVQRWSDINNTWTTLSQTLPATPDTFTDTTALPGHTYEYSLAAQTTAGLSSDLSLPSNDVATPMPSTLVALWTNASGVSLAWGAVPGATGYTVYRQGAGDAAFAPVAGQPQSGTMYVDSGLASDAAYSYQVVATLPGGQSGPGNVVTARTLARSGVGNEMFWSYSQAPQAADVASADAADAGGATVGLQFTPTDNGYVTAVQFYKGALNTGTHTADLWDQFGDHLATATFENESQSGWQQADFAQPVYVTGTETYTATYSGTSGYLADDEGYFASGQGVSTGHVQAPAAGNGVETFGPSDAFPQGSDGANYWVQPVFFYPPATGNNSLWPPTNLTATPQSDSAIHLTWTNDPPGATAVTVQISGPADGGVFSDLAQVPAGQEHCDVPGLLAGTAYSFRLVASNAGGESSPSIPVVTASTLPVPTPTGLTATAVSESRIDLNWTDTSAGETGFTVERSLNGSSGWNPIGSVSPGVTDWRDVGVNQGRTYYYRVDATDAAGASQFSNVASASTPYSIPTVANAASVAQTTVTGTTDALSVLGATTGGPESDLSYTWSVSAGPSGATFSPNGANAAKNSTITFAAAGTYTIQATIQNGPYSVTSSVQVTVVQTLTSIVVTPAAAAPIMPDATQQFAAAGFDQFGAAMSPPSPSFAWSVASGGGSVDQTGLFTAGSQLGQVTVQAAADGVVGQAAILVNENMYKVTLGGWGARDDAISGGLSVTSPDGILAANPADAVRRAVGGTVTVTDIELSGTSGTATFPDDLGTDFTLVGPTATSTPLTYTGTIELTFPFEGYEEFFQDVTVQQEPNVYLTAYRTGGNFGQPVSTAAKASDDPSQYIVLVNDNYDQNLSGGMPDDSASTAPLQGGQMQTNPDGSPLDPDFGRLTLNLLPTGITSGTVTLTPSDPSEVEMFKSDGTALSDTTLNLANPTGGLAPLASGPMDVWFEATKADPDFTFTVTYADSSGNLAAQDTIHINFVQWSFVDGNGDSVQCVPRVDTRTLQFIADNADGIPSGPLNSPDSFVTLELGGLSSTSNDSFLVASDGSTSNPISDSSFESSDGIMSSKNVIGLYSDSADETVLSDEEVQTLQQNFGLDAVHNPKATVTLWGQWDKQQRDLKVAPSITWNLDSQVILGGQSVSGSISVVNPNPNFTYEIQVTGSPNPVVGPTANVSLAPPAVGLDPYYATVTVQDGNKKVIGNFTDDQGVMVWLLPPNTTAATEKWSQQAFAALQSNGDAVPAYLQSGASLDVGHALNLNNRISSAYAAMYDKDPNAYAWSGLAANVSHLGGQGIGLAGISSNLLSTLGPLLNLQGTGATQMYQAFTGLNQAIFLDMYRQFVAYDQGGISAIRTMSNEGVIVPGQLTAWQEIDSGEQMRSAGIIALSNGDQAGGSADMAQASQDFWSGNLQLAQVEQDVTAQNVYNNYKPFFLFLSNDPWFKTQLVDPVPGSGANNTFSAVVPAGVNGGQPNVAEQADRWQWVSAANVGIWATFVAWQPSNQNINAADVTNTALTVQDPDLSAIKRLGQWQPPN